MRRMMVMGMGITGRAVTTALQRRDIDVIALDDRISDDLLSWAADHGVSVHAPATVDMAALLRGVDGVLPAPGVPRPSSHLRCCCRGWRAGHERV